MEGQGAGLLLGWGQPGPLLLPASSREMTTDLSPDQKGESPIRRAKLYLLPASRSTAELRMLHVSEQLQKKNLIKN